MIFSPTGQVRTRKFTPVAYKDPPGLVGIGKEFDADGVWKTICQMIHASLKEAGCSPNDIVGIAATSQRHGAVFLDEGGQVVYAGPNLDARGVFVQDLVAERLEKAGAPPTGCWPPLLYSLCRLLWFKQQKPDLYSRIRHILSINDWIVFKLTGKISTDPSQASSTMFMDIHSSTWSSKILEIADIPSHTLPPIREPGTTVGAVTSSAGKSTGLRPGTPVAVAGADTQCALLGSAATDPGALCIVAGNTAPIQLVTERPLLDEEKRLWTGRHLLPNRWVLEANAGTAGSVLSWFVKNIVSGKHTELAEEDLYAIVEKMAASANVGSLDTIAMLGPQIMDASSLTIVRPAIFLFPPPASPAVTPISIKELARSIFENICYAVRANTELLAQVAGAEFGSCIVAGGMARSQFWRQMVADVTGLEVRSSRISEASSLGAAICAASAAGLYASLEEAVQHMVRFNPPLQPRSDLHSHYNNYFTRWKALYKQAADL